jgi:hypothetical protein
MYVRYVDINDGSVREDILGYIPNSSSSGYFSALTEYLDKVLGQSVYSNKCYIVGLEIDGAENMVGHNLGLAKQMKDICSNMLSIHCVAHRLQLAVIDVSKDTGYLKIFDNVVRNIFNFYHGSSKRLYTLNEISEVLEEEILKLRDIHTVRWLASKVSAVTALPLSWKAIVTHLEQLICNNESDAPTAKGLLNDMKQFKFVKFLHFFMDFYSMLNPLSVALQNQELLISSLIN